MYSFQNLGKIILLILIPFLLNASEFSLKLSTQNAYVGEGIYASLELKYDKNEKIINYKMEDFTSSNFWVKDLNNTVIQNGDTTIITSKYVIFPQLSGNLEIQKQKVEVATRENKTNFILWKTMNTTQTSILVKPLPKNIVVLGNYSIDIKVDKLNIKANEPTNVTLSIKGDGNIDDIKPFKLALKDQLVFGAKPTVINKISETKYGGIFTQKFSIVAQKDFTIPKFMFTYFNIQTKKLQTLETKTLNIKVKSQPKTAYIEYKNEQWYVKYILLIVGILVGLLISIIIKKIKYENKNQKPISVRIKNARSNKALYNVLLPYSQNPEISKIIRKLEDNLYNNATNKINKKVLLKLDL